MTTKAVICTDGPCAGESVIVPVGDETFEVRVYTGPGQHAKATYAINGLRAQIQGIVPEAGSART